MDIRIFPALSIQHECNKYNNQFVDSKLTLSKKCIQVLKWIMLIHNDQILNTLIKKNTFRIDFYTVENGIVQHKIRISEKIY